MHRVIGNFQKQCIFSTCGPWGHFLLVPSTDMSQWACLSFFYWMNLFCTSSVLFNRKDILGQWIKMETHHYILLDIVLQKATKDNKVIYFLFLPKKDMLLRCAFSCFICEWISKLSYDPCKLSVCIDLLVFTYIGIAGNA